MKSSAYSGKSKLGKSPTGNSKLKTFTIGIKNIAVNESIMGLVSPTVSRGAAISTEKQTPVKLPEGEKDAKKSQTAQPHLLEE